jgi:phage regulator Rha-like protein
MPNDLIPFEIIENRIFIFRNTKVMIDRDLAELYDVLTKVLNQAVKRNFKRFPEEFMFQLNDNETKELVTNCDRFKTLVHSTSNPYAFTEHGVVMLASILNSERAIAINVQIVKAFVKLREMALINKDISQRIDELESQFINFAKETRTDIDDILKQLKQLKDVPKTQAIGFSTND